MCYCPVWSSPGHTAAAPFKDRRQMPMIKRATLFAAVCGVMAFGCGPQDETEEIVNNLVQAGFPANDIMIVDGWLYLGRDAHVTLDASREMLQVLPGHSEEQY